MVIKLASPGPYVVGLDLAKHVLQAHVATPGGLCVGRERLSRDCVLPYFESLPASLVAMEALALHCERHRPQQTTVSRLAPRRKATSLPTPGPTPAANSSSERLVAIATCWMASCADLP